MHALTNLLTRDPLSLESARTLDAKEIVRKALDNNVEDGTLQWKGVKLLELIAGSDAGKPVLERMRSRSMSAAQMRALSKANLVPQPEDDARFAEKARQSLAALQEVEAETTNVEEDGGDAILSDNEHHA